MKNLQTQIQLWMTLQTYFPTEQKTLEEADIEATISWRKFLTGHRHVM